MFITMESICDYAGTNPAQTKFVEGERVLQAGHIIKCGKNDQNLRSDVVSFTALCLQTSNLKQNPHEINGEVLTNGKILYCVCSCKAGLGEKCKHIIATLLCCYRKGDTLDVLSCTDKQCGWKLVGQRALEKYNPAPLLQHQCFSQPMKNIKIIKNAITRENFETDVIRKPRKHVESPGSSKMIEVKEKKRVSTPIIEISESQHSNIRFLITSKLPNSALAKHMHKPITVEKKNEVTNVEKEVIKIIFQLQDSEVMKAVKNFQDDPLQECCENTLNKLSGDFEEICEKTKNWYAYWHRERQYRITGSICYNLYTYTKNKKANWKKKCCDTFTPKNFKTEYTEYGKKTEEEARNVFRKNANKVVVEIGLVVSRLNPWLAYSPDGVILKDNKPTALLEIKCPFKGKTASIEETVNSQMNKCLFKDGENIRLKEKHRYYGQIQLGMAVLNLKLTYFVIYSSFDTNLFTIRVDRNDMFIFTMLTELKKVYYAIMLHEICTMNDSSKENASENTN